MQLNSIFPRVSGRIVSVKLVWIRGNPGYKNIRLILEAGQDLPKKDSPKEETEDTVNKYTHLRGPEYYGGDFNE